MANYSLLVNSLFHPFSYLEMLAPVASATLAQQDLENLYSDLSSKAGIWDLLANDPSSHALYKNYSDALDTQAAQLSKEGLTPIARLNLLNMRARYSKEIVPLEQAFAARSKQAEQQLLALLQDPTMMFDRNAATTSLIDYTKNPQLGYTPYSGRLATSLVAATASALAKELLNYGSGKPIDAYTSTFMKKYGFSSGLVFNAINNPKDPNSSPVLNAIVDLVVNSSGVKTWNSPQALDRLSNYARQGLTAAIGTTEVTPTENYGARTTLSANLSDRNAIRAENRADVRARARAGQVTDQTRGDLPIDIHLLVSPNQEGNNGKVTTNELIKSLGLSPALNGKYAKEAGRYLSVKYNDMPGGSHTVVNTQGESKFRWFTSSGQLINKDAFVAQGKGSKDQLALGREYDRVYGLLKSNVPAANNGWNAQNISSHLASMQQGAGAYTMGAMKVSFKDNDKVLKNLLPILTSNGDQTAIKEVASFDKTGKVQDNGKIIKAGEFLDSDGKLKGTPIFFASPNANTDGIFMKFNGKTYIVPRNKLGNLSDQSYGIDIPALKEAQLKKQEWIAKYGADAYYSSQAGKKKEQIIDNSGANYLRSIYNTLGWSAEAPSYDVSITSPTQIP